MPSTTLEYQLTIRNRADDGDLLVLSSRAGDTNCLLTEAPTSDGQRIDVFLGTQEIGVVQWRAIDRDDGGDTRTITSKLADAFARNQVLSNKCIGKYAEDGGSWITFHTGFLNSKSLEDALTFGFTVGDTDRREQDAELFKFLTPSFNRGSYLIGGPIPAITPTAHGETPKYSFGNVKDYGPVRMQKVAATGGTNVVAFEIVSGYVRPYYRVVADAIGADEVETINRLAQPWAVPCGNRYGNSGRRPFRDFPGLIARLTPVGGGTVRDFRPVGVPNTSPQGAVERLVNGTGMGLWLYWPAPISVPSNGDQFDVIVFPNEISDEAPLHWAGNPIDLVTLAWTQEGIAYNAAAAAAVRSVLADLWVEYVFTGPMPVKDLVSKHVFGPFGVASRLNASGEQVLFLTRDTIPASVATVTVNDIPQDD